MKGLVYTEMGRPNVLRVLDVKKPVPQRNQILVKVKASSINSTDFVQHPPVL